MNLYTRHILTIVSAFALNVGMLQAQGRGLFLSRHFSASEYNGATQNWCAVQDSRGVMYFANGQGVLEYDGASWNLIRVDNESAIRSLAADTNGRIYVGAFGEMGFLCPNLCGQLQYQSLMSLVDKKHTKFSQIWNIYTFGDTVFFLSDSCLYRYCNGRFSYWTSKNGCFYYAFKLGNQLYIQETGVGLQRFDGDSLALVEKGNLLASQRIHSILPFGRHLLICTRNNGLFLYKSEGKEIQLVSISLLSGKALGVDRYFKKYSFYHGLAINNNLLALSSITGDLLLVDTTWQVREVIDSRSKGIKSPVNYLYLQKNNLLWLALDNGISVVEINSPFRYWTDDMGVNGVVNDVAKLDDFFYVSTQVGNFFLTEKREEDFLPDRFSKVEGDFEQSWAYLYFLVPGKGFPKGHSHSVDTLLLVATRTGVYQISGSKSTRISGYEPIFCFNQSKANPAALLVGLTNGAAIVEYHNGSWVDRGLIPGIKENIEQIAEDSDGNVWLKASFSGIYRITNLFSSSSYTDNLVVEKYDTSSGLPDLKSLYVYTQADSLFFYSQNSFFTFNEKLRHFQEYNPAGNPELTDSSLDTLVWRRVWKDIISGLYVTHTGDSIIWFSTEKGLFRYTPDHHNHIYEIPSTIIRKVVNIDSTLFFGTNFADSPSDTIAGNPIILSSLNPLIDKGTVLEYKRNSLIFNYASPYFEGDEPVLFSYQLVGYDKLWSAWTSSNRKEYTNLPEGFYTFRVKAKNYQGVEGPPAEFRFRVKPPWYRTVSAYFGYMILAFLIIAGIIKAYTYRLVLEKNKLERLVAERTQEILQQKEEIQVQAEHLKDANERILLKNAELEAQKNEIESQKNKLEESNATMNTLFSVIAHDLRNPISIMVNFMGILLSDFDSMDRKKVATYIEELNRLALNTYNLLENLLDWSKSQMGSISCNFKPVNLKSLVVQNVELVQGKIDQKKLSLKVQIPEGCIVSADENMLHTIVRNLISNALKYTHDNGEIMIYTEFKESTCYLSVKDNGIGISSELKGKLFRADREATTPGIHNERGSGLGLILCKTFAEQMGGNIMVESQPGLGSTFTVTLKLEGNA